MTVPVLTLDDGLADLRCTGGPECRAIISAFWMQISSYRANPPPLYAALLPMELAAQDPAVLQRGIGAVAAIRLADYPDEDALWSAFRDVTSKKGRVTREIQRARAKGYTVARFLPRDHAADLRAVHLSKSVRNGRPLAGRFYLQSESELARLPAASPDGHAGCPVHRWEFWGVFAPPDEGGNTPLVGYVRVRRQGHTAWYDKIMGHGDHMKEGIVYLLHYCLVSAHIRSCDGLSHLVYHQYSTGRDTALNAWKVKALFQPAYLLYAEDRPWRFPMSSVASLLALGRAWRGRGDGTGPDFAAQARATGVRPADIEYLQRLALRGRDRADRWMTDTYLSTSGLSAAAVASLAPRLFPRELLADARTVRFLLWERDYGVDTVVDALRPHGFMAPWEFSVHHALEAQAAWFRQQFECATGTIEEGLEAAPADALVVAPHPLVQWETFATQIPVYLSRARYRLLIALHRSGIDALGLSREAINGFPEQELEIQLAFSRAFGVQIGRAGLRLRSSAHGGTFWVWVEGRE